MAPKRNAREPLPSTTGTTQSSGGITFGHSTPVYPPATTKAPETKSSATISKAPAKVKSSKTKDNKSAQDIAIGLWNHYLDTTPSQTKLIDVFMAFLVVVGALQFVYCVIVGNFPFNAFLSGFSATVGQFVLTASLRMQTNVENKADFSSISPERAFADYVFGSMILHFFCVNFIN